MDILIKCPVKFPFTGRFYKFFIRLLLLFCFFYSFSISASTAHEILEQIPLQDRVSIRLFFDYVIYQTPSPFTLFGDKPMSGIACMKCMNPFYLSESSYNNSLPKYYEVWKKYAHLFPSKKYLFIEYYYPEMKNLYITLFNKKACIDTMNNHLSLFQEILGETFSSQELFNHIVSSSDVPGTLKHHQGLYGLLFGFGKVNAFRFHAIYYDHLPYKPLNSFNSDEYHLITLFRIPDFVAVSDDPETIFLEQKYRAQREAIIEAYLDKDFLEVTLTKWMEE